MLNKILRPLRPAFHADFVAVELSDSFQTLSRRLEAMNNYRSVSRSHAVLAAFMLALLAAVAVVPWRVVAQEAKGDKPDVNAHVGPAENHKPTVSSERYTRPPQTAAADPKDPKVQLIVGAWRRGNSNGKLTIRKDGTFHQYPHNVLEPDTTEAIPAVVATRPIGSSAPVYGDGRNPSPTILPRPSTVALMFQAKTGRWKIEGDRLVMTIDGPAVVVAPGPAPSAPAEPESYTIARLDDSFLRLVPEGSHQAIFLRKAKGLPPMEEIADKVPPEIHRLAQLLELDSKEAIALAEWNKESNQFDESTVALLQRLSDASDGKTGYKEVFQWSDAESQAYSELIKLAGSFSAAAALVNEGVLAPDEMTAMKKIRQVGESFRKLAVTPNPINDNSPLAGATRKFRNFLDPLQSWVLSGPHAELMLVDDGAAVVSPAVQVDVPGPRG